MRTLVEILRVAQRSLLNPALPPGERQALLRDLHTRIPAPALTHYLQLIDRKRPAVALVSHGVCSECHLRVASGLVATLEQPKDMPLCENCGCYLLLSPEDFAAAAARRAPKATAPRPPVRRRSVALA